MQENYKKKTQPIIFRLSKDKMTSLRPPTKYMEDNY